MSDRDCHTDDPQLIAACLSVPEGLLVLSTGGAAVDRPITMWATVHGPAGSAASSADQGIA
jgi:hypothetical protein